MITQRDTTQGFEGTRSWPARCLPWLFAAWACLTVLELVVRAFG